MTTFTNEQNAALQLAKLASTNDEKAAAISALKAAFPNLPSYKTKWSDGTVSE